jgi:hypothetical protein
MAYLLFEIKRLAFTLLDQGEQFGLVHHSPRYMNLWQPEEAGGISHTPPTSSSRLSRSQIAPAGFAALLRHRQSSGQTTDYKSAASKNTIY